MSVAENSLAREGKKLRSLDERRATLERLIYPKLGARQIDDIRRSDVVALLDKIEDERGPVMADRALALVRKIFNWHASRSDTFESPIVKGMTRSEPRPRERILSDAELKAVWLAIEARPSPFGRLVQFLLLTAARRTEASATTWDELSDTDWIVPAARYKTDKELIVPLSGKARERLDGLPRVGPYVFTTNGRTSISGYSKFKAALDAASGTRGWTLHDLRRTARTLMSRAGVSPDIAERCLGHVIGGVRGVYDRFEYIEQKRAAFERLAAEIARIVAGVTEFS
jgi:integrase